MAKKMNKEEREARDYQIKWLIEEGTPYKYIAKRVGCSISTVGRIKRKYYPFENFKRGRK